MLYQRSLSITQRNFSRNYCPTIVKFCLFKQDLFCQHTLYEKEMSVLRPEDNVDNDTTVLNKHSVVKKSQLAKGDLMDGLTGQNNGFKLAENQEKI